MKKSELENFQVIDRNIVSKNMTFNGAPVVYSTYHDLTSKKYIQVQESMPANYYRITEKYEDECETVDFPEKWEIFKSE